MNINYKSDFVIKVSFSEKLTAFKLLFRTSGQKGYTAELKDDGTTTNCKVSDKDVYVVFKDHFLGVGQLAMELVSWRTDVNFDGVPLKNVVPSTETIYLIDGLSDGVTEAEVSTAINYAVISSYTMAKANGYSGTEADYNVYLATLPQVVGTASDNNTAYENAEGIRKSNENARTANEETRVNAESLRNGNENDRKSVEALRVNNESSRSSAENTRTANESVRISNENSRILHEDERIDNEDERKESEGKRVIAETSRVNAEQSRVAEFSTLKQASETATTNAETAAQNVKDGNTPILRVGASGNWEVSYDNGATYTDSGTKAQGDKGDSGAVAAVVQIDDTSSLDTMTSPGVYQLNFVSSELINYKPLLLVTSKNGVSLTQWVLGNFAPDGQTSLILSSDNRISIRSGDIVNGNYVWDAWSVYNDASNKVSKDIQIKAGLGLTGGGTLGQDRTLDIVSANDGITVNADNIQLNTQDVLNGTSTTKPLSAKQGAELNYRLNMYGTAGGTAQAIILTVSASITLSAGMRFTFKPIANNTATSPTININNLGAKTILRGINAAASDALIANDIVQNIDAILEYDGTNFRLLNPQTGGIVQTIGTDTDKVMSQKAVTDAIANSMWYGIEWDTTISTPTCTRIGNIEFHKSLPVQSRMKGCLLDDNGDVVEYLNPTDWTGNVRDGSRGQVMVELPLHYIKFETEGTKRRVRMSELPLPGYKQVKLQYVSAYEATVDRTNTKLASVLNLTEQFRGGNNNTQYDGTYRTFIGRCATALGRQTFRSYARNRKADSTEWNCMTYGIQKELYWLFAVEYATLNSQAAFNAEKTSDGYRQGGLGNGVSNASDWANFNDSYPFVPIGHTDALGNGSGEVLYTVSNGDTGQPISQNVYVNRYRGVENPFGHVWQWTDGINIRISPTAENGGDNLSKVYVCEDPLKFNDSNYTGYHHVGNEARGEGYVKSFIFGEEGDIMPDAVGGGNSTYACDYHYTNIPTAETLRGVLFGGIANGGSFDGFAYAYSISVPSNAGTIVGSRLCFIPE